MEENLSEYLEQVIPHEVAHYITRAMWGGAPSPHGPEWRSVMRKVYGLSPDRCHQMDVSKAANRPYIYGCGCGSQFPLSERKHISITSGAKRICKKCKGRIRFLGLAGGELAQVQPIAKLFVSSERDNLTGEQVSKILDVISGLLVKQLVVDATLENCRTARSLAIRLKLDRTSFGSHHNPQTLPAGVSHAIIFSGAAGDRQRRIADALKARGANVRYLP